MSEPIPTPDPSDPLDSSDSLDPSDPLDSLDPLDPLERRVNAATLLDWRRRVTALYTEVRSTPEPAVAHSRWRQVRDQLFSTHPDSPLPPGERAGFAGLPVADYDPAWRFEAPIDTDVAPLRIEVDTGTDGAVPFQRAGQLHLPGVGDLDVWWLSVYGGGVFVPVRDRLAGRSTYGGGRYLIDTIKGADLGGEDGTLVADFNFAYNPSCAYDPAWACPLAPQGNVVAVEIPVGELTLKSS